MFTVYFTQGINMRFILNLVRSPLFRCSTQCFCIQSQTYPIAKVVHLNEDEYITIKLPLRIKSLSYQKLKAPKNEKVSVVLSRIKLMAALQRKKEELHSLAVHNYSNTAQVAVKNADEYVDVYLIENDRLIDERTPNVEAWNQASILKIGDITYEIQYNIPNVKVLTLPDNILAGCILRPHFILECASFEDCAFSWFRSVHDNSVNNDQKVWVKVGEDSHFLTSNKDVGCYIKVICTPKHRNKIGPDFTTVSKNVVERGPVVFPFERRHAYTSVINDSSRFRCTSYNTLANMYVERKKFPYASSKALDVYYRKQLLFREILGYNSDIICLQEVQERVFHYDFKPVFENAGFHGFYMRKGGRRQEGLATFFRPSKFNILFTEGVLLNKVITEKSIFVDLLTKVSGNFKDMSKLLAQDTALQVSLFENAEYPQNKVVVANTHLYSNKNTPEVRLIQAALCVYYIENFIKTKSVDPARVIFCGDFNSLPHSEAYNFLTSGSFQCCPSWKKNNINSSSDEDTTLRHSLHLDSACGTPEYTNYTEEFQGCLDYIFYSSNCLDVTDVAPMPGHDAIIAQVGLPSEYFPSDHLALVCTLKWKNKDL